MESQFTGLNNAGEEAEQLCHFLEDVPSWSKLVSAIYINCNSQSAIERVQSNMYNGKSTHIRCRYNTIRQLLSNRVVAINYVKSNDNIVDLLNQELVKKFAKGIELNPLEKSCFNSNLTWLTGDPKI